MLGIGRPRSLVFALFVALVLCGRGSLAQSDPQKPVPTWIEIIEVYDIPADPHWRESALMASRTFSDSYGWSMARREEYLARFEEAASGSKASSKSIAAVRAAVQKEARALELAAVATRKLRVIRAWDGVAKGAVVLVLGEKQRSSFGKFREGQVIAVDVAASNVPDHFQARGRPTVARVLPSSKIPSDFLLAANGLPALLQSCFATASIAADSELARIGRATKQQGPGNGTIDIEVPFDSRLGIDPYLPWYCEFRLWELDASGKRSALVKFEGPAFAVQALPGRVLPREGATGAGVNGKRQPDGAELQIPSTLHASAAEIVAIAQVRVPKPGPFGYDVELVSCSGVRPKASAPAAPSTPAAPNGAP